MVVSLIAKNFRSKQVWINSLFLTGILLANPLSAQQPGMVKGVVVDPSDRVLQGATVKLREVSANRDIATLTREDGKFFFTSVMPGSYLVRAEFPGFRSPQMGSLTVQPGEEIEIKIPMEVAALAEEATVESSLGTGGIGSGKVQTIDAPLEIPPFLARVPAPSPLYFRGRIYSDWFGLRGEGGFSNQFSNRVKVEIGSAPGDGWTARFDLRNRQSMGDTGKNVLSIYDARITRDDWRSKNFFSFGQMNLYDSGGIGELLGGVVGRKLSNDLLVGGYYGLQPDLYSTRLDSDFRKFGFFARYVGRNARQASISFNELRYHGQLERRYLYFNGLTSFDDRVFLYGNVEYELAPQVTSGDRLTRLFGNSRIDVTENLDLTLNLSLGKGFDFHRYLLESIENPVANDINLERYYYSTQYGFRARYKLGENLRLFAGLRQTSNIDQSIQNKTVQLGFSHRDVLNSGFSLFGIYNINRGDRSESDSFYLSAGRTFGRINWTGTYSTSFNGLRFDRRLGRVDVIHLSNQHTVGNELFITINRIFGLSFQYEHVFGGNAPEDLFFVRLIVRM